MSVTNSSPTGIEKPFVEAHERPDDHRDDANKETSFQIGSSPDRSAIQRVLKEVGLTSATFIGPEFPPNRPQPKLDKTLDEFYKEIEMLDTPIAAEDNSGETVDFVSPHPSPLTSTNTNSPDRTKEDIGAKPFNYQQSSAERPSSWPHWYQKEPYVHRGPRDSLDFMHSASSNKSQWHHSQTANTPKSLNLTDARPPRHHPPAFLYPHLPTQNIPPPNISCRSSEGPGSLQGRSFFTHPGDNVHFGLSKDGRQQFCQLNEGDEGDRPHSQNLENVPWKHQCQTPAYRKKCQSTMVLILMRGLPGSGKSTLAR